MKLIDHYNGSSDPFQGDRILQLRGLPVGARIDRAMAIVTPVDLSGGADPFAETIRFTGSSGDWGTTKMLVAGTPTTNGWVEVDFHARRTLARVRGASLNQTTLQVDLGGAFVEVNANGGMRAPGDTLFSLPANVNGNFAPLPGLAVTKLKLTRMNANPDVTDVVIRSAPANVSLRFGEMPAFYTHVGELVRAETTPDFTLALQAFLAEVKAENGFYIVPLVLHSDSIARLQIEFNIEFIAQETVLPGGVNEVVLPFDFSRVADAKPDALHLEIPAGSRLVPRASRARVAGIFADTRIVYDPLEKVSAEGFVAAISPDDPNKADKIKVAPDAMQAQPIALDRDLAVTAIDLLIEVKQTTRLQLNIREDLDGKPGSSSLLPKAVDFEAPGPVGLEEQAKSAGRQKWTSVTLPAEFQFKAVDENTRAKKRYWLILQSVENEALWSVASAKDAPNLTDAIGMKRSSDGGLSWREAATLKLPGPLTAFFRLRRKPERFTMPIALQVGTGASAVRAGLDRFAATGRVDFTLDFNDVNQALEKHLANIPPTCREVEHLVNGDFERWTRVGDEVRLSNPVSLDESQLDVIVSPDGALVYAINQRGHQSLLSIIDANCNKLSADLELGVISISKMAISPDGSRICLFSPHGMAFHLLDTRTRRLLGTLQHGLGPIRACAFSPDGGRLYVVTSLDTGGSSHAVNMIETAKLEQALLLKHPNSASFDEISPIRFNPTISPGLPTDIAVTLDGSRLFVLVNAGAGNAHAFDTAAQQQIGNPIPVGRNPSAIAVTPDSRHALVTDQLVIAGQTTNGVSIIDTAAGAAVARIVIGRPPHAIETPPAIVVSSDGERAYVANRGSSSSGNSAVNVIDLARRSVVKEVALGFSPEGGTITPRGLSATPQGDRIYVAVNDALLSMLQVGAQQPDEWTVTSGQAKRICLNEPFHQVAQLAGETPSGNLAPAALSQITPVTASCAYDFSFYGITNANDAFAEVFWLGGECGPINPEPDRIPIKVDQLLSSDEATPTELVLHRKRLTAPAGAEQVEVRFNIPSGGKAWIDRASLRGTTEAIANSDFSLQQDGRLADWTLAPSTAPGFIVIALDGGVRLQNAGANTVELVQRVAAKAEQPFLLEVQNTATASALAFFPGGARPRLEARWLGADGRAAGSPTSIEIQPAGLGAAIARGTSPTGATQAEIHLIIPPGGALEIKSLSLRFPQRKLVPITFIADAPGDLTVSDWQVSYEEAAPERPPIPPRGLCPPTPPERNPGETPEECGFCHCCEAEREMTDSEAMQTAAGRPVLVGHCVSCGSEMIRFGGALVPDSPHFSSRGVVAPQPFIIVPPRIVSEATARVVAPRAVSPPTELPPITAIKGIGERLAAELARHHIKTMADLAKASPQRIAEVKGVSESQAAQFIAEAQKLLAER